MDNHTHKNEFTKFHVSVLVSNNVKCRDTSPEGIKRAELFLEAFQSLTNNEYINVTVGAVGNKLIVQEPTPISKCQFHSKLANSDKAFTIKLQVVIEFYEELEDTHHISRPYG
jgi:uracil-DNA glycosylase